MPTCFVNYFVSCRNVKLSSPNINNVLLLGCVISYSSVYMESLERETVGLCKVSRISNLNIQ